MAFFLLFDIGVLVLNFYTSFKIDQDTVAINLAGRQRYVSQRIARTLLELDAARVAEKPYKPETLAELRAGAKIFDLSHKAFREGATLPGGDGKPVFLEAVTSPRGRELEGQVESLWRPYFERLQPLMADGFSPQQLADALAYSQANNIRLLGIANDFVTETQAIGASRASALRMVQTGGVLLALLNFIFILFKFLTRLRTSDAAIEAANEENREILTSVREGLFLLTADFRLGSQLSQSSHTLFGRKLTAGDDFFALLAPLVSEKALTDARDYVQLLFAPHVKEALVQGINPLSEVEIVVKNRLGQDARRHLSFHFNRVQDGGAVRHLLVTVQDISARIDLEARLLGERLRSQKEFAMLLKAIDADPALLRQFVTRAEASLLEINDIMRSTSTAHGENAILKRLEEIARRIHSLKGDAGTLGLETVAGQAHQFEAELLRIRESGGDLGSALLSLPLPLEDLLAKVSALKSLAGLNRGAVQAPASPESVNAALARLALDAAADTGARSSRPCAWEASPTWTASPRSWCARSRCSCCAMRWCTASRRPSSAPQPANPRTASWMCCWRAAMPSGPSRCATTARACPPRACDRSCWSWAGTRPRSSRASMTGRSSRTSSSRGSRPPAPCRCMPDAASGWTWCRPTCRNSARACC